MLTIKLPYSSNEPTLINEYIYQYTGLFYKIYNNPELMIDPTFINQSLNDYIDRTIYDFCVSDVKIKLSQHETLIKNKETLINNITKELLNNDFNTKKERRYKFRLIKKLSYLNRTINNNICFGGKANLRNITKIKNNIKNIKQFHPDNIILLEENLELLTKYEKEFKKNRRLGLYLVGRACEFGNRKIDFDFFNNKITFKPNRNCKIELIINPKKKQQNELHKLQQLINDRIIPITVRITSDHILLSYNEELLNGYSFNEISCKAEQKQITDKEVRKDIYKKYKREQEERKLKNKIRNRYLAVDLNPYNIGISVVDKINDSGKFNIIHKECVELSGLSKKLNKSSSDRQQIRQNNKRKHEIKEVWKYIFKLVHHYKVSYFVMEELNFKPKVSENTNKEFNRKTKNLWHRTLTEQLITKYCNIYGVIKIEVNPCYSSFIGNMIYDEYDPIAASLELNRRGIVKYIKGSSIYPELTIINQEKLNYLLDENIVVTGMTWIKLYGILSLLRYRNLSKDKLIDRNLCSNKSKVRILCY